MSRNLILYFYLIIVWLFIQHCASPKPLTGGPKDELGPLMIRSFPDSASLHVKDSKIIIKFNEFLNPQSYAQDVWISPNTTQKPEIRVNGKKIKVFLKEKLLPEQTYTVVLTNGIVDFHERNSMKNTAIIPFSTGGEIDESSFYGKVSSAYTKLPQAKYLAALIPKDSVDNTHFTTKKPFYFTKTDESGNFNFQFIKPGNYYTFIFDDKDQNGIYTEGANESIAIEPKMIHISAQKKDTLEFQSFVEDFDAPKVKKASFTRENQLELEFAENIDLDSLKILSDTSSVAWIKENKNIRVFMPKNISKINIHSLCDSLNNCRDTLIDLSSLTPNTKSDSFFVQLKRDIKPDTVILVSSSPFISTDSISIQDTSGIHLPVNIIKNDLQTYICFPEKWDSTNQYVLHIPKGVEMYGKSPDSLIKMPIKPKTYRNFGSISGTCETDYTNVKYVWTHIESGEKVITQEFKLTQAKVGTYKVWVFSDVDNNGKWSSGKVNPYIEPEPLFRYTQEIKVKGGFDVEDVKISWKE